MKRIYEAPRIIKTHFENYDFITISMLDLDIDGIEDYGEAG